ncbi:MAG: response regulator [Desulfurivibrio sp.]|nr:MAG: response regulator [Desulfurivibrio sp.]
MAKILVIDDEEQIRGLLKRIFQGLGHMVITADNGAVGLKMMAQESFDLVITDIFMPEKEGMETIIEIKRDFPAVKILAVSGGNSQGCDYLPMTRPLGADASLTKPFSREDIVSVVNGLLGVHVSG